ncbi:MAG: EF-P lysine aminoacylase GenX [Desulfobulbus sp.]|jgi:lysyl-tRNA synthetase class 2|uniref:EF-P lysine aminoacylase EpmA n=1 Tax=Desulfobulbus sp. TaxID=895 RepID=UPI00283F8DE3|nr:EF-P lysine aminoacylase EpmA [Desulfobulbus sp.]MDR2550626.1 EF-P lysine aminoacylase GenX [Desulfobulbus sp.]
MLSPAGLRQRSDLLQAIRSFFLERDYIEVDTPLRLPILIPEPHLIPFSSEGCFLQTSPEICMKRLLAGGCERIFQICHCFRKEECGRLHQAEFTMLEWYHKGWNYFDLMRQCEELIGWVVRKIPGCAGLTDGDRLRWQGAEVALAPPWERLTVAEAFQRYAAVSATDALRADRFDEILVVEVEPNLGRTRPVFLYDYPVELGSLARRSRNNPAVAERFELYVAGVELANGFSELTDPLEQRQRFQRAIEQIQEGGKTAEMPERLLADLSRLGEVAGIALGVDRLCMLLLGHKDIAQTAPLIFAEL